MAIATTTHPDPSTITTDHNTAMLQQQTLDQLRGLRLDGMIPSNNVWRCWCSASWTGATASAWRGC
jgi:hypothetical protein